VNKNRFELHHASAREGSPWSLSERIRLLLWNALWLLTCRWTPKPLNSWRLLWLRIFGCKIEGRPFVHQRARIQIPWHVTLHDRSSVGDRANLYSLGEINLGRGSVIAQEAYLCTGTHDFDHPDTPLLTATITIGAGAFVGARAFVLPGVCIGEGALVGACSVVFRDLPPWTISAGNPNKIIGTRERSKAMGDVEGDGTSNVWSREMKAS
jgi:putative colanic acid biosynthesis acetyltransferase WcaF